MSGWTHRMCEKCWETCYPGREPHRLMYPDEVRCCFCGERDASGIFVREDRARTLCTDESCEA